MLSGWRRGAYQVGYAIQLCRCIAQVSVCIQAKSLYIDIVVADTVEATALIAAVGVEEPGLVFTEILIVNGRLPGLHDTIITKVVVCGLAVLGDHALKTGLQLSALIEAKASAVYGKYLYAGCRIVRASFLDIEDEGFALFADLGAPSIWYQPLPRLPSSS